MKAIFYTDKEQKIPNKYIILMHSFLQHSKAYLFLDDLISGLILKVRIFYSRNIRLPEEYIRVPKEDFIDNLTKIYNLGKQNNFEVIFLNQPSKCSSPHQYDAIIRELYKRNHILFLDIQEKFNASNLISTYLFIDDNHTSVIGHRLIAESIFAFLKKEGLLE